MNAPSYDVAHYLQTAASGTIGATSGWSISMGDEPADPDGVITIYDTLGLAPDTDQLNIFHPTIQVRTRSLDYTGGYAKQVEIRTLLHAMVGTFGASQYLTVMAETDINHLGYDRRNRYLFATNYAITRV